MNVTYRTDKINRHIDHKIKKLPTDEILLTATQVRLAISNSTNTRWHKHQTPETLRFTCHQILHKHVQSCSQH